MSEDVDTYDAGDEAKVAKRTTKAKRARDLELDQMRAVLATEAGRAVLWRLMAHAGIMATSFAVDPYLTARNEGRREQGIWLFTEIEAADPSVYLLMCSEANDRKTA